METNLIQQQSTMLSLPPPLVWYQLLDSATGQPYKETNVDAVTLTPGSILVQFRKAIHVENSSILTEINDGKEDPLKEDSSIDGLGTSKKEALVVVVPSSVSNLTRGDEIKADASPTTLDPFRICIKTHGIDIDTEHLKRNELVGKLQALVTSNPIVLLSSPAASGKSSLFKLYKAATKNATVLGVSFLNPETSFAIVSRNGLDLQEKKISEDLAKKNVVFFFDDAHRKYGDVQFWESLVKATKIWLPENIKFIISVNHSLSGKIKIPVEFESFPKLSRMDFLLTDQEIYQFLEFRDIGFSENIRQHKILKDVLVKECGGLVGAVRMAIDSFKDNFYSLRNDDIDETLCLQYYLSDQFLRMQCRCFGSEYSYPTGNDFKMFLKDCFENKKVRTDGFINQQDNDSFFLIKKYSVLVELPDTSFGFSSPLAKRYFFKWIFPNFFFDRPYNEPSSLQELVRKVISSMSFTFLKNSTLPGDFPKKDVFQHLFLEGLILHTLPYCSINMELSKIFPSDTNFISQQHGTTSPIDFYLNGNLHWGIELQLEKDGISEHLCRFSIPNGQYASLAVNDYVIVDLRSNKTGSPTNTSTHPNRISVVFKNDDYSVAQCFFGIDGAVIELHLAD